MLSLNRGFNSQSQNSQEEKLVLTIARILINPEEKKHIRAILEMGVSSFNWSKFIWLVQYHSLIPITYIFLKDEDKIIPPVVYKSLRNGYFFSLANNMLLWNEFLLIAKAFDEHDIFFAPLKGISFLGDIYPDINYRGMVDIDILVKEESLESVENILLNIGFNKDLRGLKEEYWRKRQCHIAFVKGLNFISSILVEVHWDLDFERFEEPILPELWLRTTEKDVKGQKIRFLSYEDTIFSLALHKRRFGNILSLKGACDLAIILNKYNPMIDWDYIIKWARLCRMETTLYFSLSQIGLLDNNLVSHSIFKQLNVPSWKCKAINSFILKNTFSGNEGLKYIYLKAHFLLYDSVWEPVRYILNIPQEQFAKFYGLVPYRKKTEFFYRARFLYILCRLIRQYCDILFQ